MNEFRLQLKLKDGQSLDYIQMRDNKPYYDYGYSEATLFDPVGILNLLDRISLDKYDVIAKAGLDSEKAAEEVLATDGAGHLLSGYDGKMVEHDFEGTTFYMFRQN